MNQSRSQIAVGGENRDNLPPEGASGFLTACTAQSKLGKELAQIPIPPGLNI